MIFLKKLPDVEELQSRYSLDEHQKECRINRINEIKNILSGNDDRKIIIVGPCSADKQDAVLDYTNRLAELQEAVKENILIIPRIYTSKPRTTGAGYKGLLHNPNADKKEDLFKGVIASRELHIKVIKETDFYCADEMLYPEEIYYFMDLLAYMAVGARSVEKQGHRMVASGANIPIGLKNPTSGNKDNLINSILAAQLPHRMIYRGWEVECEGNPYAHAILRGFVNNSGKHIPNYHYEDICELHDKIIKSNVRYPSLIIDCNHSNSGKNYIEQIRIAQEIFNICKMNKSLNKLVKGLMIESYIVDGNQLVGGNVYGNSITDSCLGWDKTEYLIKSLAFD